MKLEICGCGGGHRSVQKVLSPTIRYRNPHSDNVVVVSAPWMPDEYTVDAAVGILFAYLCITATPILMVAATTKGWTLIREKPSPNARGNKSFGFEVFIIRETTRCSHAQAAFMQTQRRRFLCCDFGLRSH